MNIEGFPRYNVVDAVDLRAFDNRNQDYGMRKYVESIGFLPQSISLLENSIEQIHSNDGIIGNQTLPYLWCSERAMPGGNVWSRRQLYGLVEAAHELGIEFYMGTLCLPNKFEEYETRAQWLYEHCDAYDLFITLADGSSMKETRGAINPLRRLPDGRWYEDVLIADLLRYLDDYGMDGYFAGDGWCGLGVTLEEGDYHPDMIDQFEAFSGLVVPGKTVPEKAKAIWGTDETRAAWIRFYARRWARFYKKLADALHKAGKKLISLDPWARGPADALFDYGVDYKMLAEVGYDALCLQAREENWGRNGADWFYSWEAGERINIAAIRAFAPNLKLHWAICICNAPEHWIATRDAMPVLERQSLSLPTITYIDQLGRWQRALDGLLFIFGTDATRKEWDFIKRRWDHAFTLPIKRALGPALVWSDNVYQHHLDQGQRWQVTASATYLVMSGAPVHSAVHAANLPVAQADAYLLVDPLGITDAEVDDLLQKQKDGAGLIVVGEVDNEKLRKALGIKKAPAKAGQKLVANAAALPYGAVAPADDDLKPEIDLGDTVADGAEPVLEMEAGGEKRLLISRRAGAGGVIVYVRRRRLWQKDQKAWSHFDSLDRYADSLPDTIDRLIGDMACLAGGSPARADKGMLYALDTGKLLHLGVENGGTTFYNKIELQFKKELRMYEEYPMKRYTPAGYIHFDAQPKLLNVTVPPDGSVELKIKLEGGLGDE